MSPRDDLVGRCSAPGSRIRGADGSGFSALSPDGRRNDIRGPEPGVHCAQFGATRLERVRRLPNSSAPHNRLGAHKALAKLAKKWVFRFAPIRFPGLWYVNTTATIRGDQFRLPLRGAGAVLNAAGKRRRPREFLQA